MGHLAQPRECWFGVRGIWYLLELFLFHWHRHHVLNHYTALFGLYKKRRYHIPL